MQGNGNKGIGSFSRPQPAPSATVSPQSDKAAEAFISGAPDAGASVVKGEKKRSRKLQISHTIPPELLEQVDEMADKLGISRAAFINMATANACRDGLDISGNKDD